MGILSSRFSKPPVQPPVRGLRGVVECLGLLKHEPSIELWCQNIRAGVLADVVEGIQDLCDKVEFTDAERERLVAWAARPHHLSGCPANPGHVRHVFFDFDQTISVIHVFAQVSGWESGVSPPHAICERGQIHRIMELNAAGKWAYVSKKNAVELVPAGGTGCSWTAAALGGAARVESLRAFFSQLKQHGVKLTIITKGNVGAARCLLAHEGLLVMFEQVYGTIGNRYGTSDYDLAHQTLSEYEGAKHTQLRSSKADLIRQLMEAERLDSPKALLVEDDPLEIKDAEGLCQSVFLVGQKGMTDSDMSIIRKFSNLGSDLCDVSY